MLRGLFVFSNSKIKAMATTKKHLISFRTNTTFSINYETLKLVPQTELILLSTEPKYGFDKKGAILKGNELTEFRLFTSLEGINIMIGELRLLATRLQTFEQMSAGMNSIIEEAKKNQPK